LDFKTGLGYSNANFLPFLDIIKQIGFGNSNGIGEQSTSKTTEFPKQGIFAQILSLNNVFFFRNSKLDADIGYITNDRRFEDSDKLLCE
jgi:iron complex outermembrane receptor protein